MFKNSSLKETEPSNREHFVCADNPLQIIWHKVKKSSKIGQDFKNFLSNFVCFFTAIVKVLFPDERLNTRLRLHSNLTFF